MINLDVENNVFKESEASYDRISVLLPFYRTHPEMRPLIELRSPYEMLKLLSRIYPYNSLLFKIVSGNTTSQSKEQVILGYVPLNRALNEPIRNVDLSIPYAIDSNKVNAYRSFIDDCLKRHIKLYIVCSPYFLNQIGVDPSMAIAKKIAAEYRVNFIDFSKDNYFLSESKLFDDTVHLNVTGSRILSNRLID